eukprot:7104853-Pyramimonas_sp.AAC.1
MCIRDSALAVGHGLAQSSRHAGQPCQPPNSLYSQGINVADLDTSFVGDVVIPAAATGADARSDAEMRGHHAAWNAAPRLR